MTTHLHQNLTLEKWRAFPLDRRILNIASELTRAKNRLSENDLSFFAPSLERAFELIDLTIESVTNQPPRFILREILRLREVLAEIYLNPIKQQNEMLLALKSLLDLHHNVHNLELEI